MSDYSKKCKLPGLRWHLEETKGKRDIILYCTACGSVFVVTGITEFDGEFEVKRVENS